MNQSDERVDEIAPTYLAARTADRIGSWLFWITFPFSFAVLLPHVFSDGTNDIFKIVFILLSVSMALLSLFTKFRLLPAAERLRRKQLLTDAFEIPLTTKTTVNYYNNGFPPSYQRLAAHTMENCYFGKELSGKMLVRKRLSTYLYFVAWFAVLSRT